MRRIIMLALALLLAFAAFPLSGSETADARSPFKRLAPEVYFHQTGHHVSGAFLRFWWFNGGLDRFGFPLTETFEKNGLEVQYFERARFEYHPHNPSNHRVLLGHLGWQMVESGVPQPDAKRLSLLGLRASEHHGSERSPFDRYPADLAFTDTPERRFFPQTGHFLAYGFKHYWERHGGLPIFGYPISEEFTENGRTVQYFERARFAYHPEQAGTRYEVQLGLIGRWAAEQAGVDMTPVGQRGGTPVWPDGMFNPPKWIEIDLSTPQRLIAWERDTPVFKTYVSAGRAATPTPVGTFEIIWKLRFDDMTGGRPGTRDFYFVPDVPHVMYFHVGGYAIHGAFWHSNWGYPASRGCVNLNLAAAEWLFNWAPYGTPIWIRY